MEEVLYEEIKMHDGQIVDAVIRVEVGLGDGLQRVQTPTPSVTKLLLGLFRGHLKQESLFAIGYLMGAYGLTAMTTQIWP